MLVIQEVLETKEIKETKEVMEPPVQKEKEVVMELQEKEDKWVQGDLEESVAELEVKVFLALKAILGSQDHLDRLV